MIYYDINIDKLEVTFERNDRLINQLAKIKVGDSLWATDKQTGTVFLLHRITASGKYPYLFSVFFDCEGIKTQLGMLYCGFDNPNRNKIYLNIDNEMLYIGNFKGLTESLQRALNLKYYQVSKLDLALDCEKDLTKELYRVIRHDCLVIKGKPFKYDVVVNGKKIGMKDKLEGLSFLCTGTRAKPTTDKTLYIQNKKKSIGVRGYDKGKEIEEASHKEYQRRWWKNGKVYRIEVSLSNATEINQTINDCGVFDDLYTYTMRREQIWESLYDNLVLEAMFFHTLNRLIYFTSSAHRAKEKISAVEFAIETLEWSAHPIRKGCKAHTAEPTTEQTINKQSGTEQTTAEPPAQPKSINQLPPYRPLPSQYRQPRYIPNRYSATPSRPLPSQNRPSMHIPNRYRPTPNRYRA
ncbi:MAG: hypothetical protein J5542_09180 [Bacteroidales bacterium]|nr:hypothetical protein [Bacteroidales bacterium]